MKKFEFHSESLIKENIAKLAELFPECVTEVINENNKLEKQVDFDVLKSILKESIITGDKERYQFTWPGKQAARDEAFTSIDKSLRPCKEESVNFDTTENLYIEGDNLTVLKLLRHTYHGKIKMIYIDPPYNTGSDFVYNDKFKQTKSEYDEISGEFDELGNRLYTNTAGGGQFHTNWLNMIYPRLLLARDLLSKKGLLFISIDDNELSRLLFICSEVFGQENVVGVFPRVTKKAGKSTDYIAQNHDYVVAVKKTSDAEFFLPSHTDEGFKFSDEYEEKRGKYKLNQTLDYDSLQYSSSLDYPITIDGQIFYPGGSYEKYMERKNGKYARADWAWRWSKELFDFGLENGFIVIKHSSNGRPRIYTKTYQNCTIEKGGNTFTIKYIDRTKPISSLEFVDNKFSNDNSKKNLLQIFETSVFDYSKPISLLEYLIQCSTRNNDIVLDFFSGSATTAHAVMKLNAEDGSHRKFIMVQVPEKCDEKSEAYKAGYKNICEIGKERIRRAGNQILAELKAKNDGNLFAEDNSIDVGFRVFKQSDSVLIDMRVKPEEVDQITIKQISKFKTDRTPEDLLFYSMLELGIPLSEKVEKFSIGVHSVYKVENANLIACFDNNINEDMVTEVAKMNPDYFILREDAMDDSLINNIDSIFKVYTKNSDVEDRIRIL